MHRYVFGPSNPSALSNKKVHPVGGLSYLVGVSGFELCYFGMFGILSTFIHENAPFYTNYTIISNSIFCSHPLNGFCKDKFIIGTCFLQNHVYTNK